MEVDAGLLAGRVRPPAAVGGAKAIFRLVPYL
jgi:hypothetical protein